MKHCNTSMNTQKETKQYNKKGIFLCCIVDMSMTSKKNFSSSFRKNYTFFENESCVLGCGELRWLNVFTSKVALNFYSFEPVGIQSGGYTP